MNISIKAKMYLSLLTVLIIGLLFGCGSPSPTATTPVINEPSDSPETVTTPAEPTDTPDRVDVVYFHRPSRCSGCRYAEATTKFTVETFFKDELASGKLVFKAVNLGDEANATIVAQYGAATSSLFINGVKDDVDHIEEVMEIWFLLGKDQEFVSLVKSKIEKCFKGID